MTCIIGLIHGGKTHLIGDSCVSFGHSTIAAQGDPKCFNIGPAVVGICGTTEWEYIFHRLAIKPPPAPTGDVDEWVRTELMDHARQVAKNHDMDTAESGNSLIGIAGRLYYIDPKMTPWRPLDNYAAVGSGAAQALAIMALLKGRNLLTPKSLDDVMAAVAKHNASVGGPWVRVSS